ncbi:hypothetical protein BQ8794_70543 [Mesorhizobium prunaredense]|uniref:Uncharacterized protein n=1 Tax=Mesorhizobium prunaredense TaxID=1631249 RepID=A0A1R3VIG3_9HYPH|nr:hypothetical protein BQ8794_70543 [Mesorhizobium prunaredense]
MRGPYPAAQREIKGDATVLVQQLIRALQRVLGSFYTLSGLGHFEAINFKHLFRVLCGCGPFDSS